WPRRSTASCSRRRASSVATRRSSTGASGDGRGMTGAGRTRADGEPSGGRRVLVIGADSRLGASVVEALREQGRIRFVAGADGADASGSPAIARLIADTDPDTVVHLGLEPRPSRAGGRAA